MRLLAYVRLLNRKINSANNKAQNPFLDYNASLNPFHRPFYNTMVWVENEKDSTPKIDDKY